MEKSIKIPIVCSNHPSMRNKRYYAYFVQYFGNIDYNFFLKYKNIEKEISEILT